MALYKSTDLTNKTVESLNQIILSGVGYLGIGKYNRKNNPKSYIKWVSMLKRCYSERVQNNYPTYTGCFVDERWHNFQNFAKWFEENYDYEIMEKWQLDKDVLIKGNKTYSAETCSFLPKEINSLVLNRKRDRGDLPIGVRLLNGSYHSRISIKNKYIHLGCFSTPEEAFEAYKVAKEHYIKEVAEEWKDQISEKVYQALINYQVEITD